MTASIQFRKRRASLGYRYRCAGCGQPFEDYPEKVPEGLQKSLRMLEDPPPLVTKVLGQLAPDDQDPEEMDVTELEELELPMDLRGALIVGPCCRDQVDL